MAAQPPTSSCLAKRARQQLSAMASLFQSVEGRDVIPFGLKYFREKEGEMFQPSACL